MARRDTGLNAHLISHFERSAMRIYPRVDQDEFGKSPIAMGIVPT